MLADVEWTLDSFNRLDVAALQAIHMARQAVFVVEQNCAYQDADAMDAVSWHLCGWGRDDGGAPQLLAYLRLIPPGLKYEEAALGRVITTPRGRGQGLGKALLERGLGAADALFPGQAVKISAQHYLERFYQSFGFATISEVYQEDNIPHIAMRRPGAGAA